jgi:hypothetical protein
MFKHLARPTAAFLAYNLYAIFLISAFQENTGYLFDKEQINSLIQSGAQFDQKLWGWRGHYIWMLFSSLITTVICSLLSGAISKDQRGLTSLISSLPSVLVFGLVIYIMQFSGQDFDGQTGNTVVAILGIPLTVLIAYHAGKIGAKIQKDLFQDTTVLGIRGWHLIWLAYPTYFYALGAIEVAAKLFTGLFLAMRVDDFSVLRLVMGLTNFVLVLSVIAWCAPIAVVYKILSRQLMSESSAASRFGVNLAVIVGGAFFALGIQAASYWLIRTVHSWL